MRYIALLRGINVGGNNKVPMSELRTCFEAAGYENVTTYINSGNAIFDSEETGLSRLVQTCEHVIEQQFGFSVRVSVISEEQLRQALTHAPEWWDKDPASKHNALFVIAPAKADEIMRVVGEAKPEYEQVASYGNVIFWSAPLSTFGRSRWAKIVGTPAYQHITIRNANTAKKLLQLVTT
jgi:uncharacterized protein (DUF1697 family)